ncbi:MAG: M1 family aminopeptidase [Pseudobdellovibrio sp.]
MNLKIFIFLLLAFFQAQADDYKVALTPDFKNKSIKGSTEIKLDEAATKFSYPIENLQIDRITPKADFTTDHSQLSLTFKKKTKSFKVEYHGKDIKGLVFGKDYLYSNFDTCTWMICNIEPANRGSFKISLKLPRGFSAVTSQNENQPYSTYLFGFAAGKFNEAGSGRVKFFGVDSSESMVKKFNDTERMMKFFEEKSGVKYPHNHYTQVLVNGSEAQEKNSFSLIGQDELDPILENPHEDWVIAHELAHQWWGNLLTCKDWSEFWLNEGITVFMVAAYKEEHWGKADYDHEIELFKKRYQNAIDAKFDVPLTFKGEYPSMKIKRAIVYSKGALFMLELRKKMGDEAFWKGLKIYTQSHTHELVESKQFQAAMEEAYLNKLDDIFNKWVY